MEGLYMKFSVQEHDDIVFVAFEARVFLDFTKKVNLTQLEWLKQIWNTVVAKFGSISSGWKNAPQNCFSSLIVRNQKAIYPDCSCGDLEIGVQ